MFALPDVCPKHRKGLVCRLTMNVSSIQGYNRRIPLPVVRYIVTFQTFQSLSNSAMISSTSPKQSVNLVALASAFVAISFIFVGARLYSHTAITRHPGIDDGFIALSWIFAVAVLVSFIMRMPYLSRMTFAKALTTGQSLNTALATIHQICQSTKSRSSVNGSGSHFGHTTVPCLAQSSRSSFSTAASLPPLAFKLQ